MTTGDVRPRTSGGTKQEAVRVIVRCRPLSTTEISQGHQSIVKMDPVRGVVELKNPTQSSEPSKDFTFDAIYNETSKQVDLYDETFRDLVDSVLNGFNGTIFAYGQTGTGKTYTMEGRVNIPEERGVIYNCFEHIFQHIAQSRNQRYLVRASYLEIYQEEIHDLLQKDKETRTRLELKERADSGVYVKDLSTMITSSVEEIQKVMARGNANRSVGRTNMNEHSSRSHAIFIITVECCETDESGENHIRVGRLNLVDLAGSERQAKTGATGERFKEATKINLSLSALGNVISSLVDGKSSHVPYRDSKLTRLLQDSLGGNSKTVMVACIGPASYNFEETLGTLRYANRAKNIKNKPKINEDPKDALLREFQDEINRLRTMLDKRKGKRGENGMDSSRGDDYYQEQRRSLEADKQKVLRDQSLVHEERRRIIEALDEREKQLERERKSQADVVRAIERIESQMITGTDLVDHTRQQQNQLENRRKELAEQKRKEREVLQQLEQHEDDTAEIHQTFTSLQQEVDAKSRKLTKIRLKLKKVRNEISDTDLVHSQERQDLERDVAEINKELKLKLLIVDNFIPPDVRERVKDRATWSEEEANWRLPGARPLSSSTRPSTTDTHGKLLTVEGQGLLTRSFGADSGISSNTNSTNGLKCDYLDKRPISIPGLHRPMSSCERTMVDRARELMSRQKMPFIAGPTQVEPILNEDIIRFCGENVLVFSGLERAQNKVIDFDTMSIEISFKKRARPQRAWQVSQYRGVYGSVPEGTRPRRKVRRKQPSPEPHLIRIPYPLQYKYHPPQPIGDTIEIMRRATEKRPSLFDLLYTCASSESSESEGICADYASKNGQSATSSVLEVEMWAERLQPQFGRVRNLNESFDWNEFDHSSKRAVSVPRSSPALSMMTSLDRTSRATRIPRLMSHSYSANSTPSRPNRATSCASAPVCGSREQLCDDFVDIQREARKLLLRSRQKTPIRSAVYDERCLLPPSHNRLSQSLSVSPTRFASPSQTTRLLQRPQISRTGDYALEKASLELSMLRSHIQTSFKGARMRSLEPVNSSNNDQQVTKSKWRRRNEFGGRVPLSMEILVRWRRLTSTRCRRCRREQRLSRLSRRSINTNISSPGVRKSGVCYRSRCSCGRPSLPSLPNTVSSQFSYLTDWAALFAAIAFLFRLILSILPV